MIIIYDKANLLKLPYADERGAVRYHQFTPGRNEVSSEDWEAIKKYNAKRMEHYERYLRPLNEEAASDKGLDYDNLKVSEVEVLIENTMEIGQLDALRDAENNRDKPRKSVLSAIDKQVKAITEFEEKVEKGE